IAGHSSTANRAGSRKPMPSSTTRVYDHLLNDDRGTSAVLDGKKCYVDSGSSQIGEQLAARNVVPNPPDGRRIHAKEREIRQHVAATTASVAPLECRIV